MMVCSLFSLLDVAAALTCTTFWSKTADANEHQRKKLSEHTLTTELHTRRHTRTHAHAATRTCLLFPMASLAVFTCGARLLTFLKAWLH